MERFKYIVLVLLPSLFLLFACEKDATPTAFTTVIELADPTDAGRTYIRLHGQMSVLDGISEAGFVYWESENAADSVTIAYNKPTTAKIDTWLEGLKGDASYSYYMYIGNGADRMQSATKNFRTLEKGLPLISEISAKADNPTAFSARIKDDGIADGLEHLTRKGICWNTEGSPTVDDLVIASEGDATGFDVTIPNLQDHTTYYLRAFAENDNSELAYGPELKIEMGKTLPQLGEVLAKDTIKKEFTAEVTDEGGSHLIAKGFCWNTAGSPTVENQKLLVEKEFTAILETLEPGTTYHIRAFAENAFGVAYSEAIEIRIPSAPKLGEIERTDPETNTFESTVADNGGSEILEYGFCWNQTGTPINTDNPVKCEADFIAILGELEPGTYYIRAYATSKAGTGYSNELSFTIKLITLPEVGDISRIDPDNNILQSSILQNGGSEITEWGFCWSDRIVLPTVRNERKKANADFVASLGELDPGVYYIRAYAINKAGIGYSRILTITISEKTVPVIGKTERIEGLNTYLSSVKHNGGDEIIVRGFCWNSDVTEPPTIDDDRVISDTDPTEPTEPTFTASLPELEPGTYYIRAYAINSIGVGYGEVVELVVEPSPDLDNPEN